MARQDFFAYGRYLGSRQIPTNRVVPGLEIRPHRSYAFWCGWCGDVWARIIHQASPFTDLEYRNCRKHGDPRFASDGRLSHNAAWMDSPIRYEPDWPAAAVALEFEATLNHFIATQEGADAPQSLP